MRQYPTCDINQYLLPHASQHTQANEPFRELQVADIKVKSFRASWSNWNINWRGSQSGKSTITLPVKFRLELEPGSSRNECMVGQKIRGKSSDASGPREIPGWIIDEDYWWTGDKLTPIGFGEWDGLVATFKDEPGFQGSKGALYYGDMSGTGYSEFHTYVCRRNLDILAEIHWFMRIDVPNPGRGGLWWSYSDQK